MYDGLSSLLIAKLSRPHLYKPRKICYTYTSPSRVARATLLGGCRGAFRFRQELLKAIRRAEVPVAS